ncbi:uncharacterized protein LOC134797348 [Cydia splendana]|uniref:uncharacterized protein LOC134797348 n=1 Tax=Cydia splendana TaxID=1100963 RepID=UPI00300CC5B8
MKRRNAESGKLRRPLKRTKITEGMYGNSLLYLKFVMLWATVVLADYMLEFRFEFLWPFWMMLRSVYDSFKYQGLAFSVFFICIALTSDMICFFFIPLQYIFFAASTYVWVQYVWYSFAEKGICLPTVVVCCFLVYVEGALRSERTVSMELTRPLAAHCVGYPAVTLGAGVKAHITRRLRLRRQRQVRQENEFYFQLMRDALPESALEQNQPSKDGAPAECAAQAASAHAPAATDARHLNGSLKKRQPNGTADPALHAKVGRRRAGGVCGAGGGSARAGGDGRAASQRLAQEAAAERHRRPRATCQGRKVFRTQNQLFKDGAPAECAAQAAAAHAPAATDARHLNGSLKKRQPNGTADPALHAKVGRRRAGGVCGAGGGSARAGGDGRAASQRLAQEAAAERHRRPRATCQGRKVFRTQNQLFKDGAPAECAAQAAAAHAPAATDARHLNGSLKKRQPNGTADPALHAKVGRYSVHRTSCSKTARRCGAGGGSARAGGDGRAAPQRLAQEAAAERHRRPRATCQGRKVFRTQNQLFKDGAPAECAAQAAAAHAPAATDARHLNGSLKKRQPNGTADPALHAKLDKLEKPAANGRAHALSNGQAGIDDDHSKGTRNCGTKPSKCEKKEASTLKEEKKKSKNKDKDSSDSHKSTEQIKEQIVKEKEVESTKETRSNKECNSSKEKEKALEKERERETRERDKERERERERERELREAREYAEEIKRLKAELATSRNNEAEARRALAAAAAADRQRRAEHAQLKQQHQALQHKIATWRTHERATLERRLGEERRARTAAEHQLQRAKRQPQQIATWRTHKRATLERRLGEERRARTAAEHQLQRAKRQPQQIATWRTHKRATLERRLGEERRARTAAEHQLQRAKRQPQQIATWRTHKRATLERWLGEERRARTAAEHQLQRAKRQPQQIATWRTHKRATLERRLGEERRARTAAEHQLQRAKRQPQQIATWRTHKRATLERWLGEERRARTAAEHQLQRAKRQPQQIATWRTHKRATLERRLGEERRARTAAEHQLQRAKRQPQQIATWRTHKRATLERRLGEERRARTAAEHQLQRAKRQPQQIATWRTHKRATLERRLGEERRARTAAEHQLQRAKRQPQQIATWRTHKRATLERRLGEERRARTAAEHQLQRAKRQPQHNSTTNNNNQSGCDNEWCRAAIRCGEAETSALRRELARARQHATDQARALESCSPAPASPSPSPGAGAGEGGARLAAACAALSERSAHLQRALSAETRVKLDLLQALGDAKRHMHIQEGLISRQEKEIEELKAQMLAVMPTEFVQAAGAGVSKLRLTDGSPLDPNASVYTPKQLCSDA